MTGQADCTHRGIRAAPQIKLGQSRGAARQVPRHRHPQLRPRKLELGQTASADRSIAVTGVEGREGRDALQRVRDGRPSGRVDLVCPAPSEVWLGSSGSPKTNQLSAVCFSICSTA